MTKNFALALLLLGCPEKKAAAPAVEVRPNVVPAPQPPSPAEVEFSGTVDASAVKAKRLVFVVARKGCAEDSTELDVIEQSDVSEGKLFTEMFFPQGTVGQLCLLALDERGQQVGYAAYAKNPVTFQGSGEVMVGDLQLNVKALKARPAPKGL